MLKKAWQCVWVTVKQCLIVYYILWRLQWKKQICIPLGQNKEDTNILFIALYLVSVFPNIPWLNNINDQTVF